MKLSKIKWKVEVQIYGYYNDEYWCWDTWSGLLHIESEKKLKTLKGCKRNFERFAKANGIKDFKYVRGSKQAY